MSLRASLPDVILLDMMLPKLDGPSVLRALKSDFDGADPGSRADRAFSEE